MTQPFSLLYLLTREIHLSHKGITESSGIFRSQIRQTNSADLTTIPTPLSRNSIFLPSNKPYFSLNSLGITILPSLSTFLIFPPKKQKVRQPESAHKNTNSDSRQTNPCKIGITSYTKRNLHFIKFKLYV